MEEVAALLEGRDSDSEKVTKLLGTSARISPRASCGALEPRRPRAVADRVDFRYQPQHGRWLRATAVELSALRRQCPAQRRTSNLEMLEQEIAAWATGRKPQPRGVGRRMAIATPAPSRSQFPSRLRLDGTPAWCLSSFQSPGGLPGRQVSGAALQVPARPSIGLAVPPAVGARPPTGPASPSPAPLQTRRWFAGTFPLADPRCATCRRGRGTAGPAPGCTTPAALAEPRSEAADGTPRLPSAALASAGG